MYFAPVSQHLEKLPAFVMVVRVGSITKAAKALAISQAALSQSIKTLEDALEIPLLLRSKAGVTVTEEGELLFQYGKHLMEELDLLETKIRSPKKANIARIKVGTHEALAIHIWPEVIESFQAKNPNILFSIVSGRVDSLVSQVLNRSLDLIMTVKPKTAKELKTETLYKDTFSFYRPADSRKQVAGTKLPKQGMDKQLLSKIPILTDRHAHLSEDEPVSRLLSENGLHSAHYFQLNSFQASSRLAAKGLGVALLPQKIGDSFSDVKRIKIKGINVKQFEHSVCCSFLNQPTTDKNLISLIDFLKSTLRH